MINAPESPSPDNRDGDYMGCSYICIYIEFSVPFGFDP